jgi:hypothetical protein
MEIKEGFFWSRHFNKILGFANIRCMLGMWWRVSCKQYFYNFFFKSLFAEYCAFVKILIPPRKKHFYVVFKTIKTGGSDPLINEFRQIWEDVGYFGYSWTLAFKTWLRDYLGSFRISIFSWEHTYSTRDQR